MLVAKGTQGYVVWLSVQEQKKREVEDKISSLKVVAPVTVFCSGTEVLEDIVKGLLDSYLQQSEDGRTW